MKSLFDSLNGRGFVARLTHDELPSKLAREKLTVYAGFDPTADSLHLGHLVPIMALAHFQRAGHRVIALVGGGTAGIGDPSGRSSERNLLPDEVVAANAVAIKNQLSQLLATDGDNPAVFVNNCDWFDDMKVMRFARDIGKHFNMKVMLAKDSVKSRLESENGMSFTEFMYQIFQGWDFLHLFETFGCTLQLGGRDQWGNITAGTDLVRRVRRESVFGMTLELVTTASGEKFGKSAGNAVWLDANRTSPWELFQFMVTQDDADVVKLLKLFTFLSDEEIEELEASTANEPNARKAQRKLAFEVTAFIHGRETALEMERAAAVMFGGEIAGLSEATLETVFASVPSTEVKAEELDAGISLSVLLARTGLAASLTKARQLISGGGAYINNVRVQGDVELSRRQLATARHIVLRLGKKNYHVLKVVG